jgi:ribose-phosphate pyrophosphokinase
MMLLGFSDYRECAIRIASALAVPYAEIAIHQFPDGESRVTLPTALSGGLPERIAICRTLNNPNEKLVQLLIAAKTARALGAKHITLIAPYLCYMRQDIAFNPGEAVSQTIVGQWLADHFDAVITVDPHLHRVSALSDAIPLRGAVALSAAPLLGRFAHRQNPDALLLGPDEESRQWVSVAASVANLRSSVCKKIRHSDHETTVQIADAEVALEGQHVILIDDIVSSGGTLISAARACLAAGAARVDAIVVHALFGDAVAHQFSDSGISTIWSTDSVVHPSNAISLALLIASGLKVVLF